MAKVDGEVKHPILIDLTPSWPKLCVEDAAHGIGRHKHTREFTTTKAPNSLQEQHMSRSRSLFGLHHLVQGVYCRLGELRAVEMGVQLYDLYVRSQVLA